MSAPEPPRNVCHQCAVRVQLGYRASSPPPENGLTGVPQAARPCRPVGIPDPIHDDIRAHVPARPAKGCVPLHGAVRIELGRERVLHAPDLVIIAGNIGISDRIKGHSITIFVGRATHERAPLQRPSVSSLAAYRPSLRHRARPAAPGRVTLTGDVGIPGGIHGYAALAPVKA